MEVLSVLGISGSPRKDGNTDDAIREVLSMIHRERKVATEFIHLADFMIKHCTGCRICRESVMCVIKDDDYDLIVQKIQNSKIIIVGTPIYWHGPPGLMKAVIDRTYVFYTRPRYFEGKKGVIITVSAGDGTQCCGEILEKWLDHNGIEILNTTHICAVQKGELRSKPEELAKIRDLATLVVNHLDQSHAMGAR